MNTTVWLGWKGKGGGGQHLMNWVKGCFGYDGCLSTTTVISSTHINISAPYIHDTHFNFHASDPHEKRGLKRERETHLFSTDHDFAVEAQRG